MRSLLVGALLVSGVAGAADDVCLAPQEVDKYQLLRRLSLDLRGKAPTIEEYEALDAQVAVPIGTVQSYIQSADFRLAMRRYHEALFWPNINNVRLHGQGPQLLLRQTEAAYRSTLNGKVNAYRGDQDAHCGDYEQTHFLANKVPDPAFVQTEVVNGRTIRREGWRLVEPYWAPGTQIKVCAYDAQETPSTQVQGAMAACNTPTAANTARCGCGPNLQWCFGPAQGAMGTSVDAQVLLSMREQLNLAVDAVSVQGKPYTDLVLSTKAQINGPLSHFKRHLSPNFQANLTINVADPQEQVGIQAYTDPAWLEVDRGGQHAGVTTLPVYLLRFQTNRGRANRFRNDFLCEQFTPPAVLTEEPGCSKTAQDLTAKCSCQYCHALLEPMAAHWGLFTESGTTLMTDLAAFPRTRSSCVGANNGTCNRFYVTEPSAHNPGALLPFQFTDLHPDYNANLEAGPRKLAQQAIDDGRFARCTVRRVFAHLMKRELEPEAELALLDTLSTGFTSNSYSLPWLVEQVVSLPQYRRVR